VYICIVQIVCIYKLLGNQEVDSWVLALDCLNKYYHLVKQSFRFKKDHYTHRSRLGLSYITIWSAADTSKGFLNFRTRLSGIYNYERNLLFGCIMEIVIALFMKVLSAKNRYIFIETLQVVTVHTCDFALAWNLNDIM